MVDTRLKAANGLAHQVHLHGIQGPGGSGSPVAYFTNCRDDPCPDQSGRKEQKLRQRIKVKARAPFLLHCGHRL